MTSPRAWSATVAWSSCPAGASSASTPALRSACAALLVARPLPRRDWRPLPEPSRLAERIEEIVVERPDDSPESVLDAGDGGEIGTESPRPEASDPASTALGKAAMGAGRGMTRLGKALGWGKLAELGAGLVDRALRLAPRLSEEMLGRQAAALNDLLRQFREGDIERALRRALPLGEPGEFRGAVPHPGDQLPPGDLSYDLNRLLEDSTGGLWLGGHDVMAELGREYRKAAEEALRRGDFRRAASIYGKLLRDFRAAANALMRGGLHHDAAVLLLAKLDDRRGAARAFEAAGEVDRAVQLYRQGHEHEEAGDLLRRVGEEDAAQAEYLAAADRLAGTFDGHLAAGDLLLAKAGRPDLALAHFAAGWSRRPLGNAIPCALRIARIHAESRGCRGPAGAGRPGRRHLRDVVPHPRCGPILQRGGRARRSSRDGGDPGGASRPGAAGARRPAPPTRPPGGEGDGDRLEAPGIARRLARRGRQRRELRRRGRDATGPPRTSRGRPPTPRSGGSASDPGSSPPWPRRRDRARSSSASRGARSSASGPIDPRSST